MATNLHIDGALLTEAMKLGGGKTKRETVNEALAEFVRKRKAKDLIALFGTIDYDPEYDYKKRRKLSTQKARTKTSGVD